MLPCFLISTIGKALPSNGEAERAAILVNLVSAISRVQTSCLGRHTLSPVLGLSVKEELSTSTIGHVSEH